MVLTQLPRSEVHRGHVQGNSSEERNVKTRSFKIKQEKKTGSVNINGQNHYTLDTQ